jgi:hypothetical protein
MNAQLATVEANSFSVRATVENRNPPNAGIEGRGANPRK